MAAGSASLSVAGSSGWVSRLGVKHARSLVEDQCTEGECAQAKKSKDMRTPQTSGLYQICTPLRAEQLAALRQGQQESWERKCMDHEDIEGAYRRFREGRRGMASTHAQPW